jgi:hypothetical protein
MGKCRYPGAIPLLLMMKRSISLRMKRDVLKECFDAKIDEICVLLDAQIAQTRSKHPNEEIVCYLLENFPVSWLTYAQVLYSPLGRIR